MPKVLIADDLSPRAVEIFRARGIETDVETGLGAAELAQRIASYDGLAVRSATKVTAELIAAAGALKVIGRFVVLERTGKPGYAIYIPYAIAQARRMLTDLGDYPGLRAAFGA